MEEIYMGSNNREYNIKILFLYYDLMNLYGENGNIRVLEHALRKQDIKVSVDLKSIEDDLNLNEYDLVYIGSGTEYNQKVALNHLINYRDTIREQIYSDKIFLLTGNAFEMFGKEIKSGSGDVFEGLGIFDFYTQESSFERETGDMIVQMEDIPNYVVGYINKCSKIYNIENPLFRVLLGYGNNENQKYEGFRFNNFIGTHIIGPILVKNPHFLEYIVKRLCLEFKEFEYKDINDTYAYKAYETTLNNLKKLI